MNIHQEAANQATSDDLKEFSERRLWAAVLLQALEDWGSINSRHRADAEKFFFGVLRILPAFAAARDWRPVECWRDCRR